LNETGGTTGPGTGTTPDASALVRAVHDHPGSGVLAVAGAGATALAALLGVPGASRTVLEAVVPYSPQALASWLGHTPEQSAAEVTARRLATVAFQRARRLARDARFGVGCAAALATDPPRRGTDRIHVALQTPSRTTSLSLTLAPGSRDRAGQEAVARTMILNAVAEAVGLRARLPVPLSPGETLVRHAVAAPAAWRQLLAGHRDAVPMRAGVVVEPPPRAAPALFPGAFDPLHEGHRGMADLAARRLGRPVAFELCVTNVDKPPLDFVDLAERLDRFGPAETVWLTRLPTFLQKARWQPGTTFVVGIDTLERIAHPRYYGDDLRARDTAIETFAAHNVRFLVFGRSLGTDFLALHDVDLPPALLELCEPVLEDEFRRDVSSTELRRRTRPGT
jgi:nicotinamide mononucleotide (NMN) deamidase PncC